MKLFSDGNPNNPDDYFVAAQRLFRFITFGKGGIETGKPWAHKALTEAVIQRQILRRILGGEK